MIYAILLTLSPDLQHPDAGRFGVSRDMATLNAETAERHTQKIVLAFETDNARFAWWYRQDTARDAWKALAVMLDRTADNETRVKATNKLRWLIGDDAFAAGRMPCAIPDYGPWVPTMKGK